MTFQYFYTDKYGSFEMDVETVSRMIKRGQRINPEARFCDYDDDAAVPTFCRGLGVMQIY